MDKTFHHCSDRRSMWLIRSRTTFVAFVAILLSIGCSRPQANEPASAPTASSQASDAPPATRETPSFSEPPATSETATEPEISACFENIKAAAEQGTPLSVMKMLQQCVDGYHRTANWALRGLSGTSFEALTFFRDRDGEMHQIDGSEVRQLEDGSFAVTLRHQDLLLNQVSSGTEMTLDAQIHASLRRLAEYCDELFYIFEEEGLASIQASLYMRGLSPIVGSNGTLDETFQVIVTPEDLPKLRAWLESEPESIQDVASSSEVNEIWEVVVNEYPNLQYTERKIPLP